MKRLAVVIVTYNQHDILKQCLDSVLVATKDIDTEIVVVDNSTMNETSSMMNSLFPSVQYLRNETNFFYTRAANQGVRATKGEFVLLLNDDIVLKHDFATNLISFMDSHPECGVAGPLFLFPDGSYQVSAQKRKTPFLEISSIVGLGFYFQSRRRLQSFVPTYESMPQDRQVGWVCGGGILLRREPFEKMGLHDERYLFYFDDPDICNRFRDKGWQVWFYSGAALFHHHGLSTVKSKHTTNFELVFIRSRRHYYYKFFGLWAVVIIEFFDFTMSLMRAIRRLVTGRLSEGKKHFKRLSLILRSFRMLPEERLAYEKFGSAYFNGVATRSKEI